MTTSRHLGVAFYGLQGPNTSTGKGSNTPKVRFFVQSIMIKSDIYLYLTAIFSDSIRHWCDVYTCESIITIPQNTILAVNIKYVTLYKVYDLQELRFKWPIFAIFVVVLIHFIICRDRDSFWQLAVLVKQKLLYPFTGHVMKLCQKMIWPNFALMIQNH